MKEKRLFWFWFHEFFSSDHKSEDDYPFEILSTEQIVQDMVNSIKEVNLVIQVSRKKITQFYSKEIQLTGGCHNFFQKKFHINLDSNHNCSDFAQPFQMGQRKTNGKILFRRSRSNICRSPSGFSQQKNHFKIFF